MLRNDLKRALFSRTMILSVVLGLIAIAIGMISTPIIAAARIYFGDTSDITNEQKWYLIYNLLNKATLWSFGNFYFFIVVPLICCIPFSVAYLRDLETGYNKYQIIRSSYKKYLFSKYVATFISGFLAILIIVIINLSVVNIIDSGDEYRSIFYGDDSLFGQLHKEQFNLFVIVHGLIISCMGGIYAVMGLTCAKLSKNILVGLAFPFMFYVIMDYVMSIFDLNRWC